MSLIELELVDVRHSHESLEAYAMLLKEKEKNRVIPIIIGFTEAKAIIMLMNKIKTRRPSTYELLQHVIEKFQYTVEKIIICRFDSGVFFSNIYLQNGEREIVLDSRTSDAIALALLFNATLYIEKEVFEKSAFSITSKDTDLLPMAEEELQDTEVFIEEKIKEMSIIELENLLKGSIESEDFELATKIHNELNKRKK